MALNQAYIQQQIIDSVNNNGLTDPQAATQLFAADLAKIIVDAIKSADVILPTGAINPSNTTVVAGAFTGVATSISPIMGGLI